MGRYSSPPPCSGLMTGNLKKNGAPTWRPDEEESVETV